MSRTTSARAIASAILLALGLNANAQDLSQEIEFNIPPKALSAAIIDFSKQTGVQVVTAGEDVSAHATQGVSGRLTISQALEKLLTGTELKFRAIGESTVALMTRTAETTQTQVAQRAKFTRVAASDLGTSQFREAETDSSSHADPIALEEVAVTGSRIGIVDRSVPLTVISREQIDAMGVTTMDALLRRIPQNLADVSPGTLGLYNGGPGTHLTFDGAGVNLRGIGSSATLVLVNGRRSIAGGNGSFTDISLIPMSAIERVEILADGASAIYGSDAVGGVINFILKKDYNTRETGVSYGFATRGGAEQVTASQSLASGWGTGGVRGHLEYSQANQVRHDDRDFVAQNDAYFLGADLVPASEKLLANILGHHQLTDDVKVAAEAMYSRRDTESYLDFSNARVDRDTKVEQYGAMLEIDYRVNSDWSIKLRPQYSVSTALDGQSRTDVEGYIYPYGNKLTTTSLDVDVTRAITPSGIGFVAGGQFRREGFEDRSPYWPTDMDRDVAAVYAELRLPLIRPSNAASGRVELSLAGRYEDYEYAGSAFSPKVGLSWQALRGLNVRSTWSTSFKAPLLTQTNLADVYGYMRTDEYETTDGRMITGLMISGNNPDLEPERSKNFTLGFDFLTDDHRTRVSATYFDIRYEDRILAPNTYVIADPGQELLEPALANLITLAPSEEEVLAWFAGMREVWCYNPDYSLCDPLVEAGDVGLLIDTRLRNIASTRTRGVDIEATRRFAVSKGNLEVALSGTYYLDQEQKLFENAPEVLDMLDELYGTIDLRLRGMATYSIGRLSASFVVNYSDDYADTRGYFSPEPVPIDSLTTVDFSAAYDLLDGAAPFGLQRLRLSISAQNLFDEPPPRVMSASPFYFDGVNADLIGRYLSLAVVGAW